MKSKKLKLVAMSLTACLFTTQAKSAEYLYGTLGYGGTISTFVQLDPVTGSLISTIGSVGYAVNGLTYDPAGKTFYATTSNNNIPSKRDSLISINPLTGVGTLIGSGAGQYVNLPTANASGALYGWTETGDLPVLWNKTNGTISLLGSPSDIDSYQGSMAFNKTTGNLYYLNGDQKLYTINLTTGSSTLLGTVSGVTSGYAHHGDFNSAGKLYAIGSAPSAAGPRIIYVIDVNTLTVVDTLNTTSDLFTLAFASIFNGPTVANTNQSLVNTASALQGTYALQNAVLANSFSYDCNVFGENNVCVSAGGRNTTVQAANGLNNTSALLIAAYRPHPNYRIGAYADQNLSVSNPGGTVNLGNNTPLIGLFGAWNERLDGTGTEVKVSAAYGQKNATITRSVVGSGDGASEAGSGSSKLNSQGAQVTAKYGFAVMDNVIVSPYVGVRYTQNNMGGYTEGASSSVTAPLTYSALNTNATTALAGAEAKYRGIPQTTLFASAGVETDTNTANGTYSATNSSIGTLTPVNFNPNPVKTRPTATIGAYYDIAKSQRLGITGIYRQEAYQAVSTTTVMATYTVGF